MPEFDSTVEYRPVSGFPAYMVGNDGSVWCCWKRVSRGNHIGTKCILTDKWREVPHAINKDGYHTVSIGRAPRFVHHLVLEAFVGPCPLGLVCRHFPDRSPSNNASSNLRWGTVKENQDDRIIHGTTIRGSRNPKAKLTEDKVHQIRSLPKTVLRQHIANEFGVSLSTVKSILGGCTWKHLKPKPQPTA